MIIFKQKQKLYYNENTYKITGYITKHHALMICCLVMMIFIFYKLTLLQPAELSTFTLQNIPEVALSASYLEGVILCIKAEMMFSKENQILAQSTCKL